MSRYRRIDAARCSARHAAAQTGEHAIVPHGHARQRWTQRGHPSRLHRTLGGKTTGPRSPGGPPEVLRATTGPSLTPATTRGRRTRPSGPFFFLGSRPDRRAGFAPWAKPTTDWSTLPHP